MNERGRRMKWLMRNKEREWKKKKIDTEGAPYHYGIEMNLVVCNNCGRSTLHTIYDVLVAFLL